MNPFLFSYPIRMAERMMLEDSKGERWGKGVVLVVNYIITALRRQT